MQGTLGESPNTITKMGAIRAFFESNGGRKVTMDEMKALSPDERTELAGPCAAALGKTLTQTA